MEKIEKNRFTWVGSDPEKREGIARPSVTYWQDALGVCAATPWPWCACALSCC